jgi:hypothetical protein
MTRTIKVGPSRDWPRYAHALDMRLAGCNYSVIALAMGISKQRAQQMVAIAQAQLAYRVFHGVPRPLPKLERDHLMDYFTKRKRYFLNRRAKQITQQIIEVLNEEDVYHQTRKKVLEG